MDTESDKQATRATILVVEDEPFMLMNYEDAIEAAGHYAITADSLAVAQTRVAETVDVAILDIRLGDDKVFPVAYRLLELGIPFLFCSGTMEDMPKGAFSDVPLLHKPIEARLVVEAALRLMRDEDIYADS